MWWFARATFCVCFTPFGLVSPSICRIDYSPNMLEVSPKTMRIDALQIMLCGCLEQCLDIPGKNLLLSIAQLPRKLFM